MKLIMENWKRFLKEGVRPTGDPELPTWRSGSNDRAETDEIIAKAIELGLKRAKTLEDVSLVFDDARMEGDFSDSAAEKAEEEWVTAAEEAGRVFTEAEYPEDEPPDEDDDGALRPRELDHLRSAQRKVIDDLAPDEEVEVDLDEGTGLDDAARRLSQMDAEASADILDAVESAQARGYDATNNGLEQVLQTLGRSGGPLQSELPILKPLIQSLLGDPEAVATLKRDLDPNEVDPDDYEYAL